MSMSACPASTLALVSNPLDDGTNQANDLLAILPNKSTIQIWNGTGFTTYTKDCSVVLSGNPSHSGWQRILCKSASNFTNTFVGNVVPAPGGNTATNSLPAGTFALVGSILPVSGTFNDTGTNSFNLNATLPNKSTVQIWNGSGFTGYTQNIQRITLAIRAYTAGQGFFVKSASAANWVQTLQ